MLPFLFLMVSSATAGERTYATVTVQVVDEAGTPVNIGWHMAGANYVYVHPIVRQGGYGLPPPSTYSCASFNERTSASGSYEYKFHYDCVPAELAVETRMDGLAVSYVPGTDVRRDFLLSFPSDGNVTWFQLTSTPGRHVVEFPRVLYTRDETYAVVTPSNGWEFADGRLYALTVRRASKLLVAPMTDRAEGVFVLMRDGKAVSLEEELLEPGEYTVAWRPRPSLFPVPCQVVRDETVSAGLGDEALVAGLSSEDRLCRPDEHVAVIVQDGTVVASKVKTAMPPVPPPSDIHISVNGQEVSTGATVVVKPGEDIVVEVRSSLPSGR